MPRRRVVRRTVGLDNTGAIRVPPWLTKVISVMNHFNYISIKIDEFFLLVVTVIIIINFTFGVSYDIAM